MLKRRAKEGEGRSEKGGQGNSRKGRKAEKECENAEAGQREEGNLKRTFPDREPALDRGRKTKTVIQWNQIMLKEILSAFKIPLGFYFSLQRTAEQCREGQETRDHQETQQ